MSRTLRNFLTFFFCFGSHSGNGDSVEFGDTGKNRDCCGGVYGEAGNCTKEETAKLTAVVPEKESLNFWACAGCFLLCCLFLRGAGSFISGPGERAAHRKRMQPDAIAPVPI